jgi:hypothetical protein
MPLWMSAAWNQTLPLSASEAHGTPDRYSEVSCHLSSLR